MDGTQSFQQIPKSQDVFISYIKWEVLMYNTLILLYIKLLLIPYNIYYNINSK